MNQKQAILCNMVVVNGENDNQLMVSLNRSIDSFQREYCFVLVASRLLNERGIYFQDVGRTKHSGRGAKVLSAKVTARPDARRSASLPSSTPTLAPPMTSVVVERHQPINKVTRACLFTSSLGSPIFLVNI